jgi:hypothetical protein
MTQQELRTQARNLLAASMKTDKTGPLTVAEMIALEVVKLPFFSDDDATPKEARGI